MGIALSITAIGMTLLFLTLAFFYGLLSLMASVMEDRRSGAGSAPPEPPAPRDGEETVLRAAAIAVALARAEIENGTSSRKAAPGTLPAPGASPWWALYHQRSLRPNLPTRRPR